MKKIKTRNPIMSVLWITILVFFTLSIQQVGANEISDEKITNAVERQLMLNATTPSHMIDVASYNGIVTLSGSVDNMLAKDRAVRIAEMVKGVRGVVDEIEIDTPPKTDEDLESDVRVALINDPATNAFEVTVQANNGVVNLDGTLNSWQAKKLTEYVAKGVTGVKGINNNIDIEYELERSDYEIEEEISSAMEYDVRLDHALIEVEVDDGDVQLSGTVGSAAEKDLAIADAWVIGVNSVSADNLEVNEWARNENMRKDKYIDKTDEQIRQAVKDAFLYDPRVFSFNPNVSVEDGYVTLTGTVDNFQAKRAAEHDARNVVGVLGVNNYLKVRPSEITEDSALEERISAALQQNPAVEKWEIDVTAVNGVVYLSGKVDSYFEKSRAADIAAKTSGVIDVNNNIDVMDDLNRGYWDYYGWNSYYPPMQDLDIPTLKTDNEIKNSIENHIWWSPYVNTDDVEVSVNNGKAILAGTVETEQEKLFAEINAYEGGAAEVENNILVLSGK
ncbi:MAG: BON domain-containing protein [Bacteroidota bacterium]